MGVDLSNEIKIPKIDSFKTRKEFNEWKKQMKDFTNKNNTKYQFKKNAHGVVVTVKELNQMKKATKEAQRIAKRIQKETAKKPFISGGKKQGTLGERLEQMNKANVDGIYIPPDFDFNKIKSKKYFDEKKESVTERSQPDFFDKRQEKMKRNYINLISERYNSNGDDLISEIENIPSSDFFELFLMHDELSFEYEYTDEQTEANLEKKMAIIERYKNGLINMDMRGF